MSLSENHIGVFPININYGGYYFHNFGEFEVISVIGEGNFSEVFIAKPKNVNNIQSSNLFNYIIKIFKKNIIIENNSNLAPPKKILFYEICEINLLNKIKNIGNPNIIQM